MHGRQGFTRPVGRSIQSLGATELASRFRFQASFAPMRFSRILQSLIPLLLSPLIILWLDSSGNDKAVALSIPWVAFASVYALAFLCLARRMKSTVLLTLASATIGVAVGAFGVTYLVVSYLTARAGV